MLKQVNYGRQITQKVNKLNINNLDSQISELKKKSEFEVKQKGEF